MLFSFSFDSPIVGGLQFFVISTFNVFVLVTIMVYGIGLIRANLPIERFRNFLVGRNRFLGYLIAALFGTITPFCSCSGVPIFLGFVASGLPLGIAMTFLITSPMLNEASVVLLGGLVGWKLTTVYIGISLSAGILGGFVFDRLGVEDLLIRPETEKKGECSCKCKQTQEKAGILEEKSGRLSWRERHDFAVAELKSILKMIWFWLILGITLGAVLHSVVPNFFFAEHLAQREFWSVPLAVLFGIPTYAGCVGIIPVIGELINKGLPVGTAFAFMLSAVTISFPELVMLKTVMKVRLLVYFLLYLLIFLTLTGWTLNGVAEYLR